jgi:hypothetical protein
MRTRFLSRLAALLLFTLVPWSAAHAHQGPPFPLLMDQHVGPYIVSVWTDPDIGPGRFFVILEAPDGQKFINPSAVRVAVEPVSGRLAEASYDGESEKVSSGARYLATVNFDRGEHWRVRVTIEGPAGGGELRSEVEATPDGILGPVASLLFTVPFVMVAFVWWRAAVAKRRLTQAARAHAS